MTLKAHAAWPERSLRGREAASRGRTLGEPCSAPTLGRRRFTRARGREERPKYSVCAKPSFLARECPAAAARQLRVPGPGLLHPGSSRRPRRPAFAAPAHQRLPGAPPQLGPVTRTPAFTASERQDRPLAEGHTRRQRQCWDSTKAQDACVLVSKPSSAGENVLFAAPNDTFLMDHEGS